MKPKLLQMGDKIGLVCPSAHFKEEQEPELKAFQQIMKEKFSMEVVLSSNFKAVDKYSLSAGTAQQRADDINEMFDQDDVDCIWCFQGGNTANEVLELIDYELIKRKPKLFTGLSDITVLLNAINTKANLITFHSTDAKAGKEDWHMEDTYSHDEFARVLMEGSRGKIPEISQRTCVREGHAEGILVGGNLRCFLKLAGTPYFPDLTDKILLVEGFIQDSELREVFFNIAKLKQQKNFDQLAGVIIGQYYGFDKETQYDSDEKQLYFEQLFLKETREHNFPILKCYEFGHRCPSTFLPIGGVASFDARSGEIRVK